MRVTKIKRFAENARRLGLPVDVETTGNFSNRTGRVIAVTEETLTVESRGRRYLTPLDRIDWIGFDLSGVDTSAIL